MRSNEIFKGRVYIYKRRKREVKDFLSTYYQLKNLIFARKRNFPRATRTAKYTKRAIEYINIIREADGSKGRRRKLGRKIFPGKRNSVLQSSQREQRERAEPDESRFDDVCEKKSLSSSLCKKHPENGALHFLLRQQESLPPGPFPRRGGHDSRGEGCCSRGKFPRTTESPRGRVRILFLSIRVVFACARC